MQNFMSYVGHTYSVSFLGINIIEGDGRVFTERVSFFANMLAELILLATWTFIMNAYAADIPKFSI